jgi:metal-responsive CopG/Arc/MetJ family transcriptional regulator
MANQNPFKRVTSFLIPITLLERFKKRVPRYGDRSEVLRQLVEKYLTGDVVVVKPARRI